MNTTTATNEQSPSPPPGREQIGPTLYVTHQSEEGVIEIDGATGIRLTPLADCPVWAQGLANAMLAERAAFWEGRLGKEGAAAHLAEETISFADLAWVGIDAEGKEVEIEASFEFRSPLIGEYLGLDMATGKMVNAEHEFLLAEQDQKAPSSFDEGVSTAELGGTDQSASEDKKEASST